MRHIKKIPPADKLLCEQLLSSGWRKLKEPENIWTAILYSIPFMILTFVIEIFLIYFLYTPFREMIDAKSPFMFEIEININILLYLVFIIVFVLIHEFIHACFVPNILNSDKTFWGFNGMFGFVYTEEKIRKYRFLLISIMPYIVLSFIFPIVLSIFGLLNGFVCLLCLINAGGSCVDLLNIILIAIQVPKDSYIVNSGVETYFNQAIFQSNNIDLASVIFSSIMVFVIYNIPTAIFLTIYVSWRKKLKKNLELKMNIQDLE